MSQALSFPDRLPGNSPREKLLADLGAVFQPQRQWSEGRGILLIAGHFLSGAGAGAWLLSLWFDSETARLAAVAAVMVAGLCHLLFLGRPERFWRMFHARHSWIARGFLGMQLFVAGGLLYLAFPDGPAGGVFLMLSVVGSLIIVVYKGNVYAASRGVPFWNTTFLPILYAAYAFRGGAATLLVVQAVQPDDFNELSLGLVEFWLAVSAAVVLGFYLGVMRNAAPGAQQSVRELTHGRLGLIFYAGVLGAGLAVSIAAGLAAFATSLSQVLLAVVALLSLVGDFFAKYAIARAGIYVPLMLAPIANRRIDARPRDSSDRDVGSKSGSAVADYPAQGHAGLPGDERGA